MNVNEFPKEWVSEWRPIDNCTITVAKWEGTEFDDYLAAHGCQVELGEHSGLVNARRRAKSERRAGEREDKRVAERGRRGALCRQKSTEKAKRNRRIESPGQMVASIGPQGACLEEVNPPPFGREVCEAKRLVDQAAK